MLNKTKRDIQGFTLLEILIALFIFSIVSIILAGALHRVIDAQSTTERHAERLGQLQLTLLLMSRDIEQTINRPIIVANGRTEREFIGTARNFTFTHAGLADPVGALVRSGLQRTRYEWHDDAIWRVSWAVLDQAPSSRSHARKLLEHVSKARFEYLDKDGHFHNIWPVEGRSSEILPRAVRVYFTILNWGTISQLYVISAQPNQAGPAPTHSESDVAPKS